MMIGVKSITFERNGKSLNIYIGDKTEIVYKDISKTIYSNIVFKYLESLFFIINSWQKKYVYARAIGGEYWKLSITYVDDSKKEYYGKSDYPNNFEAFERLNQKLISEVQNG